MNNNGTNNNGTNNNGANNNGTSKRFGRHDDSGLPELDALFGLFEAAHQDGTLSAASMQTLTIVDPGAQIQAGLGVRVEDVAASEVVLVAMMPDDSGSIRFAGNAAAVRQGHNAVLDALAR